MPSPPQGYIAESVIPSKLWFNVKDYGAVGDNGRDDTTAFVNALADTKAVGGTLYIPRGRYVTGNITLPAAASGYRIKGEFAPYENSENIGTVMVAKNGITGAHWKLSTSIHTNNLQIIDLAFDANSQALTSMLDLSQAELGAFFILENVWLLGTGAMGAASNMLNLDGDEATICRLIALSPNGSAGATLKAHVTGGELTFIDSTALGGTMNVGGLQVKWVNCVQAGPIFCDSGSLNNFTFLNHWIEASALGGAAITNSSGQGLRIYAAGGRWNQQSSRAFIAAGNTATIARLDGIMFNSNDASACPVMSGGGATLYLGPSYQFIGGVVAGVGTLGFQAVQGIDNRSGLVAADGSPITLFTVPAAGLLFRISADIFATAVTAGTANYTITWTENAVARTLVVSASVVNTLGTGTDLINPDTGTAITAQLTFAAFTGTVKVAAVVEQLA